MCRISLIAFTVSYPGRPRYSPTAARLPHFSEIWRKARKKNIRQLEEFDSRSRGADSEATTISEARLHFF